MKCSESEEDCQVLSESLPLWLCLLQGFLREKCFIATVVETFKAAFILLPAGEYFSFFYSKTCLQVSIFKTPLERFIAYCSVSTIHY